MKPLRKHLKLIALFLAVTFLVQSCKVYHSGTVTVDEAVNSSKEVKVKSHDDYTYRFKKLEINKGKLYGVATRNSDAAHYLSSYIIDNTNGGKYVDVLIPDKFISNIQLQNEELSSVLSLLSGVIIVGGIVAIVAIVALSGIGL